MYPVVVMKIHESMTLARKAKIVALSNFVFSLILSFGYSTWSIFLISFAFIDYAFVSYISLWGQISGLTCTLELQLKLDLEIEMKQLLGC